MRRAALALLCLVPATAAGYVRMTTPAGVPLRWTQSCVLMSPSERGGPELTLPDIAGALERGTENWNRTAGPCSALQLLSRAPGPRRAAPDGIGSLLFVTGRWGRGQLDYDPSAAAVTTLAFQSRPGQPEDGTITDADIELNAVGFRFAILDPAHPEAAPQVGPGQRLADLENALTHELGHAVGLAHNCWDHVTPRAPLTHEGRPALDCAGDLPEDVPRQTMFPYARDGETSKRVLGADDIAGLCGAYPAEISLPPCEQTVQGGCSAAGAGPEAGSLTLTLGSWSVLLVGPRRRRRRR